MVKVCFRAYFNFWEILTLLYIFAHNSKLTLPQRASLAGVGSHIYIFLYIVAYLQTWEIWEGKGNKFKAEFKLTTQVGISSFSRMRGFIFFMCSFVFWGQKTKPRMRKSDEKTPALLVWIQLNALWKCVWPSSDLWWKNSLKFSQEYWFHVEESTACKMCIPMYRTPSYIPWLTPNHLYTVLGSDSWVFLGMSFVSLKKSLSEDMLSIYHHMAKGDLDVHVPPTNLTSNVCWGMMKMICRLDQIPTLAQDRCAWRNLVIACSAAEGWWWWWWPSVVDLSDILYRRGVNFKWSC